MVEREILTLRDKAERVIITLGVLILLSSFLLVGVWFFSPSGTLFSGKVLIMVFIGMVFVGMVMFIGPSLLDKSKARNFS